jgi:hypothetical protein
MLARGVGSLGRARPEFLQTKGLLERLERLYELGGGGVDG